MPSHPAPAARPAMPFHTAPVQPRNYAAIPQRLVADLHDTPLAIGLYALVGRLFLIAQTPVPLSTPDVMRYDPALSRGAVIRAFARLLDGGWLIETKARGHKTRYVPAWGRVRGDPLPWRMDLPCMGRPRHVNRLALDRALLDICMGKLTPHPVQTALITRYITTPALSLADVGCYALALAGHASATPALCWLEAIRNGQACPLPAEQRLLAIISQRTLQLDRQHDSQRQPELTISGTRRLGLQPLGAPSEAAAQPQPLFFIAPGMIGSMIAPMIGSMIGQKAHPDMPEIASAEPKSHTETRPSAITWESRNINESGNPPPTPSQTTHPARGGGESSRHDLKREPARRPERQSARATQPRREIPDTETVEALKTLNMLPAQLIEFASMPLATVQAAISDAKSRERVRDLAGWVVGLLRNHRDYGWKIHSPAPYANAPEALRESFACYAAQQEAELATARARGPLDAPRATPEEGSSLFETDNQAPCHAEPREASRRSAQSRICHYPKAAEPAGRLAELWSAVQAAMRLRARRHEFTAWIHPACLRAIEHGVATITVPNILAKEAIERHFLGVLCDLLSAQIGEPVVVRLILSSGAPPFAAQRPAPTPPTPAMPPPARAGEAATQQPPDWIDSERWAQLPAVLRAVLLGSRLSEGAVRAKTPQLTRLLQTRYARELDQLLAASRASKLPPRQ